eukprot:24163-Eustigmatos_ZCMA.PRE.1
MLRDRVSPSFYMVGSRSRMPGSIGRYAHRLESRVSGLLARNRRHFTNPFVQLMTPTMVEII